jgi:hypothetical protein
MSVFVARLRVCSVYNFFTDILILLVQVLLHEIEFTTARLLTGRDIALEVIGTKILLASHCSR